MSGLVQNADHIQQKRGWTRCPIKGPVSIRCRRVQSAFCRAVGTQGRAGLSHCPALSCEQPLIITRRANCVKGRPLPVVGDEWFVLSFAFPVLRMGRVAGRVECLRE